MLSELCGLWVSATKTETLERFFFSQKHQRSELGQSYSLKIASVGFPELYKGLYLPPAAGAGAKLRQSCPTLYDPIDGSPPGSSVPEIL